MATTEMPIDKIIATDRVRGDVGDLSDLVASIREVGVLHPPVVRPHPDRPTSYVLVAGYRRLEAMRQLGFERIEVTIAYRLHDELAALAAERDENTCRKDFTPSEQVALADRIEAIVAAQAKERMAEAGRSAAPGRPRERGEDSAQVSGRTREIVAKATGVSHSKLKQAREVVAAATDPGLPEPVREVARQAQAEMDATGNVHGAHAKVKPLVDWAHAVAEHPFLHGIPEGERAEFLVAARQLATLSGAEHERRLDAFKAHAAAAVRRAVDPASEAIKRSRDAANRVWDALAPLPGLVTTILDHPDDALHRHSFMSNEWPQLLDEAVAAIDRLRAAARPNLRRVQ